MHKLYELCKKTEDSQNLSWVITQIAVDFSKVTSLLERLKTAPDTRYTAIYWPDVFFIIYKHRTPEGIWFPLYLIEKHYNLLSCLRARSTLWFCAMIHNPEAPWLCHHPPGFMPNNFTDLILQIWSGDQKTVAILGALIRQTGDSNIDSDKNFIYVRIYAYMCLLSNYLFNVASLGYNEYYIRSGTVSALFITLFSAQSWHLK